MSDSLIPSKSPASDGVLAFRCNICGVEGAGRPADWGRETRSCATCGSTARMRSVIRLLALELFQRNLALPDFPVHPEIKGLGLSDWDGYAIPLKRKLGYENTFYHQEPRLDISNPDPAIQGTLDFLIASDVFEHVVPPVSRAFEGARKLLKPTGVLIFTAPYSLNPDDVEHYPELDRYKLARSMWGRRVLVNTTRDGRCQKFPDPVFHGGPGNTIEMRLFSEAGLLRSFRNAGFIPRIWNEPDLEHGIFWPYKWSLPMSARPAASGVK